MSAGAALEPGRAQGRAVRLGILLMLVGMFLFALNDAMGKWLVATYSVGQVLLIRSAFALALLLPFLWLGTAGVLAVERPRLQAARVACSTIEVFCFYAAVVTLPLADVMTYWMAAPIYVAALSPFLLGERVGPVRWAAIAVGFAGVLLALTPSGAAAPGATLLAVVGSFCFALMMVTGRMLRGTPDTALVFWQNAGALAAGAVIAPLTWVPPEGPDFLLLGALGLVAMAAHVLVTRALKLADAAVVAPFQYTLLPYAILLGWLMFGDLPRPTMLAGAAVIVAAGLVIFVREQRAAREAADRP